MTQQKEKILVIKLGALGDFIQALGPMAAIRKHHGDAHITLLTTKPYADFGRKCGYFDHVWIDERPGLLNFRGWMNLRKVLNTGGFKRVYDLQNNDRTGLYFKLLDKKKKPEWVGTASGASHRNTNPERTAGHAFDGHVQTLALAGIKKIEVDDLSWMDAKTSSFSLRDPYVFLVPGSSPQHPQKRWPASSYGVLANLLSKSGYQPVIIGSEAEKNAAQIIREKCPGAVDLTSQTSLEEMAVLARNAAGAIGNDTGPMHLIAATKCPSVVLFSSHSDPVRHAPKGKNVEIIHESELEKLSPEKVLQAFKPGKTKLPKNAATIH